MNCRSIFCVWLIILACAWPTAVCSAEKKGLKEKYNLEFVAAPLGVFNPNFGNGGGVMGMALFDLTTARLAHANAIQKGLGTQL